MGGGQSTPIPGGGTHGYHVLKVQDKSPAELSKLEAYFDFIVTIQGLRLDQESDTLIEILKVHLDREVKLGVYNIKGRSWREVGLTPNTKWGGQGVIGVSIRFCSFENVSDNIWHILEVYANSPAQKAGLCSNNDYIIGYEMMDEEFDSFIEQNNRREVKLFVYNVVSDKCRDVTIIPDQNWGGEGSLGCGVGTGYLHRIPNVANKTADMNIPNKSDIEIGDKRDNLVSEFASVKLLPASPQKKIPEKTQTNIENKPIQMEEQFSTNNLENSKQAMQTQSVVKPDPPQNVLIPAPSREPYIPSVQSSPKINMSQELDKKSPIPTASQKNLFTTQSAQEILVSPSSGLPTAPPTDFDLDIPGGTFHHTQQPSYPPDPIFKPIQGLMPSQPSYTAVSPPTIDDTIQS